MSNARGLRRQGSMYSLIMRNDRLDLHIIFIWILFLHTVSSQTLRNFPPLFNAAKERTLSTTPSQSTCGVPVQSAYCRSSTFSNSVLECRHEFCVQECPRRTSLPVHVQLLVARNYGACITKDSVNLRPGAPGGDFSAIFIAGSLCYLTPQNAPSLGANGAFTLTFWYWQLSGNTGTVLEKWSLTGEVVLRVQVSQSALTIFYRTAAGEQQLSFPDSLPAETWTYLAIQVYDRTLSYFVDDSGLGFAPRGTQSLTGRLVDSNGYMRIGQTQEGADQFLGRLEDVRFYVVTLTNREVVEVFSGSLPEVRIQTSCRCPPTHPRVRPLHTRYCIRNGVPDNTGDEVLRLSNYSHPLQYLNDGDFNSYWVSAFLDDVTIQVDLGDVFQVFYVVLQFYSPQPTVVTIERRKDTDSLWERWQLYADDCVKAFGVRNNGALEQPNSVNCIQFGANGGIPYSKGNITFSVLAPEPVARPGHNDFYNTPALAEFVKARHVRVRLQGHYYVQQLRHKYYGIYEYVVTGRCNCNGHGETCDLTKRPYICNCLSSSSTEGNQCERCQPLFNDKPFRQGNQLNAYGCRPCECYLHATECVYNVSLDPFPGQHDRGGGGQCVDCQHNTAGPKCDTCAPFFYREVAKSLYAEDVCSTCDCFTTGVDGTDLDCSKVGGQCKCKTFVAGRRCEKCAVGYFNLQAANPQGCESCQCDLDGVRAGDVACHPTTGQCNCKSDVIGLKCDQCDYGYYNLTSTDARGCTPCQCDPKGSRNAFCNPVDGRCQCKSNVVGRRCDECAEGFWDFEQGCVDCGCDVQGTELGTTCNRFTGQCKCKVNVFGLKCDQCRPGYFDLGGSGAFGCTSCNCDEAGTKARSTLCNNVTGTCECKANVKGQQCNLCKTGTFNLTLTDPLGCQPCDCDITGTLDGELMNPELLSCDQDSGKCHCLSNRIGRRCDDCDSGYYVNPEPGGGCLNCNCVRQGIIPRSNCNSQTGQCQCYGGESGIAGRACGSCKPGYWGFQPNLRSCSKCDCDAAGSLNTTCHPNTGLCECKMFTTLRQCNLCVEGTSNLENDNPFGCSKAPSQQPQPEHEPLSPTALRIFWAPPDYPNGIILNYFLYRDETQIARLDPSTLEYNDTGLEPYTDYQYQVEAANAFGVTISPRVTFRTPAGRPSGRLDLTAVNVGQTTATFYWNQPDAVNGVIKDYKLVSTNVFAPDTEEVHYTGQSLRYTVTGLISYAVYNFSVLSCTAAGCLRSDPFIITTESALPTGQQAPTVHAISASSLLVSWEPPTSPNGVVYYYELYMRGQLGPDGKRDPERQRIFHPSGEYISWPVSEQYPNTRALPPPATSYTVTGLDAYTVYEFQVLCENDVGKTASPWSSNQTLEGEPRGMPTPVVSPVSATELRLTWPVPTDEEARGVVKSYKFYHYKAADLSLTPFAPPYSWELSANLPGDTLTYVVKDLPPFKNQSFLLGLCNSIGCVNSTEFSGMTEIGVPQDVKTPGVEAFNGTSMVIKWQEPGILNGPAPSYVLRRTNSAFNNPPPIVSPGVRFHGHGYYLFPPDTIPQGVGFTGISLWFKTTARDGLLFYAASEGQDEFMAVQLLSGRPWFLFDPQGCPVEVTPDADLDNNATYSDGQWHHVTARRWAASASITVDHSIKGCTSIVTTTDDEGWSYSDDQWHHIKAVRDAKRGFITVDSTYTGSNVEVDVDGSKDAESCATGNIIGANTGVYIGGLPLDFPFYREKTEARAQIQQSFVGCVRDVMILQQQSPKEEWQTIDWASRIVRHSASAPWEGCPMNLQNGAHFLGTGFIKLEPRFFQGGNTIPITFDFRTESQNGLVLFIHGDPRNYFIIQFVNGGLWFEFKAGEHEAVLVYPAGNPVLCDGKWHHVEFSKRGLYMEATVTGGPTVQTGNKFVSVVIYLHSPPYFGGIEPGSEGERFIEENKIKSIQSNFGGCLNRVFLQRRPCYFNKNTEAVNVRVDGCPADADTLRPCQNHLTNVVYNGSDTSFVDTDLIPFTDYMYQVEVYNQAGSSDSQWNAGRTREAPPFAVAGPISATVVDGYTITGEWDIPTVRTGQVTEFRLLAYDRTDPSAPPVVAVFTNITLTSGDIIDAIPDTNYTVKFAACTWGGCTVSEDGIDVNTPQEPPENMSAPYIKESSAVWLLLAWSPPGRANGPITGYTLYQQGNEIYGGNELSFNVTGLLVFNSYEFYVQACTPVGCKSSPPIALSTDQLPPSFVSTPTLTIQGTRRIKVNWDIPQQPNGVIERYLLYVSNTTNSDMGMLLYNNSDLFLQHIFTTLTPGTTYFIRVGACTAGGCTLSDSAEGSTLESAPEGVDPPTVFSPSPSELNVTWNIPRFPNGVITEYKLYHNTLEVFKGTSPRWHLIDKLQPWSLHTFRIEACTVQGCSSSDDIQSRTQEAPPEGIIGLEIQVNDARTVTALWNSPKVPNGHIVYNVYFEGLFYVDPENWDYRVESDRRSMYQTNTSGFPVAISPLIPWSVYQVQLNASNTKGFLLSPIRRADMPMGSPDGVKPPDVTSPTPQSVRVVWQPAGRSNADQDPVYQLQFRKADEAPKYEDQFSTPTTSLAFLKQGLFPFTEYQFRLVASNPFGETRAEWVSVTTRQDKPDSIDPPIVNNVRARSVLLQWTPPLVANGILTQYRLHQNNTFTVSVPGNQTSIVLEDLEPFTHYVFQIEACTVAGCTISAPSRVILTLGAVPEGMAPPILASPTPTSVMVVWSPPVAANGDILSYRLERRSPPAASSFSLVASFSGTDDRRYEDKSAEIRPFTAYEYRMVAVNRAGEAVSEWALITTKSARPGGVRPPTVQVTSATSVEITWEPPIQPNGQLESYVIRLPIPRIEIRNVSRTSLLLENLAPFTEYRVTVTACTDGGCTESVPTVIFTEPSVPSGLSPPTGEPISQTNIFVIWQAPTNPNGPNLRYELSRAKVRQPLQPSASDFGMWTRIYTGEDTYYDDTGLSLYTTYRYRVAVFNDYGQVTSQPSAEVTTFGGTPTEAPSVSASTVNHTSIRVEWITPGVAALQGGVTQADVTVTSSNTSRVLTASANASSVIVTDLEPNTRYEVHVMLMMHGGATITSDPAYAQTRDGAPEGLRPPQLIVVNTTALRVVWMPPEQPNGRVTSYNIYVDDEKIETGLNTAGSYVVGSLQPYTIYRFKLEVCTIYDCVQSTEIKGTTAEAIPYGLSRPNLYVQSASSVRVTFSAPTQPNGIILRYELYRRDHIPCQEKVPITEEPPSGKCQYYECGILEAFCGSECYSGPKTCCDGVLYDNKIGYECCGTHYVPNRLNRDDVCCGGKFYWPLSNHKCCNNRYVEVRSDQICCADPAEDRVSVGVGDRCCGGIPFSSSGSQLCCAGKLHDKYESQCCGGKVVESSLTCCGNDTTGASHRTDPVNMCCGDKYVSRTTSVCCINENLQSKVHSYGSMAELAASNEKCCGTERISFGLSCCNGVGYSSFSQVCADRSNVVNGCGLGVVCAASQDETAFCDRCNFNRQTTKCGVTAPRSVAMVTAPPPKEGLCWTDPVRVYKGLQFAYLDEGLSPYTEYEYSVMAVNGAGTQASPYNSAVTAQAKPVGLAPPVARVETNQLDTIYLSWKPPAEPNGEIIQYVLMRDGIEIYRDPVRLEYRDDNAIQPYQTYTYRLRACNAVDCVNSPPVSVATLQAMPEEVAPPAVSAASSTSLYLTWAPPGRPNGIITNYVLVRVTEGDSISLSGATTSYLLSDLEKYGEYKFILTACSEAGCTNSSEVSARTSQDKPEGLSPPRLVIVSTTKLEVYWNEPSSPNGIVSTYHIYQGSLAGLMMRIYSGNGSTFMTVVEGLSPGDAYTYIMEAVTGGGSANSSATTVTMPTISPEGIKAPDNVTALGPNVIHVTWDMPNLKNFIDQFKIVLNAGRKSEIERGVGIADDAIVEGLEPDTLYSVRIKACIRGVPNGCGLGPGINVRTLEAPPQDQEPPTLRATGPSVMEVSWEPPARPNGRILQYRIHRKRQGLPGTGLLINVLSGDVLTFTNAGPELLPFTRYEYRVTAVNSQGETTSDWAEQRTQEAVPEQLQAPLITTSDAYSIIIAWEPPLKANGLIVSYGIDYRRSSSDPTFNYPTDSVTVSAATRKTSVSGLKPYTPYEVRVLAENSAGKTYSTWAQASTGQGSPAGVGPITVERISTGLAVILRWNSPTKPNGVIINYLVYEEDNVNPIFQGLSREFEYRRLQPYTDYTIQLEACTIGGCSRSVRQRFRTAEIAPADQAAPTLSFVNATHVTLHWSRPVNQNGQILKYQVLRRVDTRIKKRALSEPIVAFETDKTDVTEYSYTDVGLDPYTQYDYSIKAINSKGSTQSLWQRVETDQAAPEGLYPPLTSQVANEYSKLRITWSIPTRANGIIQGYQLQRNQSVPWSFGPNEDKEYVDMGLTAFTTYSYRVTACTAGGCTTSQPAIMKTQETAPFYVAPPVLSTVSDTAVQASWVEPEITNGRIREYRLKVNNVTQYVGQDREYVVGGLTPYAPYYFVLSACTFGGCTDSSSVLARPQEAPPSGMQRPMLRVTSSSSIEITWRPPTFPNGVITSYEVRRDGALIDKTTGLSYIDYEVQPGREYSYRVTAYNSKGQVESPPNTATTYSSSPSGLSPPEVTPLSSTSVQAVWTPPMMPNGKIYNYTLYKDNDMVYSDRGLQNIVNGLDFWTEYSFRVVACTSNGCTTSEPTRARTLEAPPLGMGRPRLTPSADSQGTHDGVLVEWEAPRRPNGVVTKYEVYRRNYTGLPSALNTGPRTKIYEGPLEIYHDRDSSVRPFTRYEYMVSAYNKVGRVNSEWQEVLTREAPPVGVPAPIIKGVTQNSIQIEIGEPVRFNGYLRHYIVYLNDRQVIQSRSSVIDILEVDGRPLVPYTEYSVSVAACTAGGCTRSESVSARTSPRIPSGQAPPTVTNITATSMDVSWPPPAQSNGQILEYLLAMRQGCPQPYADEDDELDLPCEPTPWQNQVRGLIFNTNVEKLVPYTTYQFRINVFNEAGGLASPPILTTNTKPTAPRYRKENPLRWTLPGNEIIVNWTNSFYINGEVRNFYLYVDGAEQFRGLKTDTNIFRDNKYKVYTFMVRLVTDQGEAETPTMTFDPYQQGRPFTELTTPVGGPGVGAVGSLPVYQEVWFIILMCFIVLLLLSLGIFCCLRTQGRRLPYIRERMPLQTKELKTPPYAIDLNGSIVPTIIPCGHVANGSTAATPVASHKSRSAPNTPHLTNRPYFTNPAYAHLSNLSLQRRAHAANGRATPLSRRTGSTGSLNQLAASTPVYSRRGSVGGRRGSVHSSAASLSLPGSMANLSSAASHDHYQYASRGSSMADLAELSLQLEIPQPTSQLAQHAVIGHPGYLNPAYSHMSIPSQAGSIADLNLDKMSHKSSRWDDEDDDDERWEGHAPREDSGLHSLAYGEDYDAASERPVSVLKEHTMFTDTHL